MSDSSSSRTTASTIKDVALLAGCSIATVSRAINTPDKVDPGTLASVRAAIERAAYRPNALGRMLRAERSRVVGVVVPTIANPVFAETVQGIDEQAWVAGYRLMLMTTEYQAERERAAIDTLRAHRVDGMIITVADAHANAALDDLDRDRVPYVLAHNDVAGPIAAGDRDEDGNGETAQRRGVADGNTSPRRSVSVDNFAAAREAVGEMIARGHRHIRMLAGTLQASDRARQRAAGYAQAMRDGGLPPAAPIEIDFLAEQLPDDVIRQLRHGSNGSGTTGLFCSNDRLAFVALSSLERAGVAVPRDMSIIGFDGLTLGSLLMPRLTSIYVPNREIGSYAWSELLRSMHAAGAGSRAPVASTPSGLPDAAADTPDTVSRHRRLPHLLRHGGTLASPTHQPQKT